MRPILPGARGPAVEDIQKRLLRLGFDLGPTGVDGVFLGKTREAVAAFQASETLSEDGVVGDATWAALVDATFTLGDRMLYLRLPHFHGHDVAVLQQALSTLGFSCGDLDAIFGRFTERAVREFQRNCGQPDDGIVGPETVRAVVSLRHVWEGKNAISPPMATAAPSRSIDPLLRTDVWVTGSDPIAVEVCSRLVNLAKASDERVRLHDSREVTIGTGISIVVRSSGEERDGVPIVVLGDDDLRALTGRLVTARAAAEGPCEHISVRVDGSLAEEHELQRAAVRLLDALCAALA